MTDDDSLRWGLSRRLEFVEWRLFWEGRVNRRNIEVKFRISTPQASIDLNKYIDIAGENISYDKTERTYIPSNNFRPRFLNISADRYLLQVRALLSGAIQLEDTWFEELPPLSVVPDPARNVEPASLRAILSAIRERREIDIHYRSLSEARFRTIGPHALGFDGHRWHVRAWCREHDDFRDFVLARISSIGADRPTRFDPEDDLEWTALIDLRVCPHPMLDEAQRKAIEQDFGMIDGELVLPCRLALAFYFIRRFNLDIPDIPPERAQIALTNLQEVESAMEAAKRETAQRIAARLALRRASAPFDPSD